MADGYAPLVPGSARGGAIVLEEPLSLWGGLDPETGTIIDAHHPQRGVVVTGSVVFLPSGRGSSSSSSTLLEAVRRCTHPSALVLADQDDILLLGAIVAQALYGLTVPVGTLVRSVYELVRSGDEVEVRTTGIIVRRGHALVIPRLGR
jgi:predicted aconitase with swiveling domain